MGRGSFLFFQVWNAENLHAYHLVWMNQFTDTINTYAKSTLEWMSAEMMNAAINSRGNPFDIMYGPARAGDKHECHMSEGVPF
jgi:hypothetical protein